jgi:hypothetical protein
MRCECQSLTTGLIKSDAVGGDLCEAPCHPDLGADLVTQESKSSKESTSNHSVDPCWLRAFDAWCLVPGVGNGCICQGGSAVPAP